MVRTVDSKETSNANVLQQAMNDFSHHYKGKAEQIGKEIRV
jgi:hypothetical protein